MHIQKYSTYPDNVRAIFHLLLYFTGCVSIFSVFVQCTVACLPLTGIHTIHFIIYTMHILWPAIRMAFWSKASILSESFRGVTLWISDKQQETQTIKLYIKMGSVSLLAFHLKTEKRVRSRCSMQCQKRFKAVLTKALWTKKKDSTLEQNNFCHSQVQKIILCSTVLDAKCSLKSKICRLIDQN